MNLFWLLVLAHLIADFPLQTDQIYSLKKRSRWGVLPHVLVCIITNVLIAFPYLQFKRFGAIILILAGVHAFLDWCKIKLTQTYLQDNLFLFCLDQLLHLGAIAILSLLIFKLPVPRIKPVYLENFLLNEKLIIILSGIVFSVFAGAPVIYYLRLTLSNQKGDNPYQEIMFPAIKSRSAGYVERLLATLGIILGGWFYWLVPLAFAPRIITHQHKRQKDFIIRLVASLCISIVTGITVRILA